MDSESPQSEKSEKEKQEQGLQEARHDFEKLGGWQKLRSGDWLLELVGRSLGAYYARSNADYFRAKYPGKDNAFIARKMIQVACRNASILGAVTGAVISVDEVTALATGAELGIGLPANISIAVATIGAESVQLMRIQLQLIANLYKLHGVPLDPEDPEDVLTILAYATGSTTADAAGQFGMKVGGRLAGSAVKKVVRKEVLKAIKSVGAKIGVKILQRQIVKYSIPAASIAIGSIWNFTSTRTIAKVAQSHISGIAQAPHSEAPQ